MSKEEKSLNINAKGIKIHYYLRLLLKKPWCWLFCSDVVDGIRSQKFCKTLTEAAVWQSSKILCRRRQLTLAVAKMRVAKIRETNNESEREKNKPTAQQTMAKKRKMLTVEAFMNLETDKCLSQRLCVRHLTCEAIYATNVYKLGYKHTLLLFSLSFLFCRQKAIEHFGVGVHFRGANGIEWQWYWYWYWCWCWCWCWHLATPKRADRETAKSQDHWHLRNCKYRFTKIALVLVELWLRQTSEAVRTNGKNKQMGETERRGRRTAIARISYEIFAVKEVHGERITTMNNLRVMTTTHQMACSII